MSVKSDLQALVWLQSRELEFERIGGALEDLARARQELKREIETAEQRIQEAETALEEGQKEGRRLEMELQTVEEKVKKYKDQLLEVKTNKELWALQEEIDRAAEEVEEFELKSIEQMEAVDELEKRIAERRRDLEEKRQRVSVAQSEKDRQEAELEEDHKRVDEAIVELRGRLADDLRATYESVREARGGVGVAEARDGACLACNFRLRPQLYVEIRNVAGILQCENCNRILFVSEALDVPSGLLSEEEPEPSQSASDPQPGADESGASAQPGPEGPETDPQPDASPRPEEAAHSPVADG